jgi:hypothetical protein
MGYHQKGVVKKFARIRPFCAAVFVWLFLYGCFRAILFQGALL